MKYKRVSIRIIFRFLFFIIGVSIFVFVAEAHSFGKTRNCNSYISDIIKIDNSIQIVNKKFLDKITFKISDNQPILGGGSVKFLLQGSDGNKWLFKHKYMDGALAASKLAQLFGINTPETFPVSLIINDREVKGYIQRFIESDQDVQWTDDVMNRNQQELVKLHIFHWLVNKREDTFYHLLVDKEGRIYSIDLKLTLKYGRDAPHNLKEKLFYTKKFPDYRFFTYFWKQYLESSEEWRLQIPSGFIYYIENFDSNYIANLLRRYGIRENEIRKFIALKKNISKEFEHFLLFIRDKSKTKSNAYFNNNCEKYALNVLNKLKSVLENKQNILSFMPAKEQQPLKIITTYFYMKDFYHKTYKQVLNIIKDKKREALNVYELLGLYLLKIEILDELKNGLDGNETFPNENFVISISCNKLSLQSIENKVLSLPPEEKFFIAGLYYAIKGQFSAALESLQDFVSTDEERNMLLDYIKKNGR